MVEFDYMIKDEHGIHARPAGELVKIAKEFQSEIEICNGEKCASAKKILGIMGLGATKGNNITVKADGVDEKQAAAAIEKFLQTNL
ncbi:MAG: HPr family phosphocarrier protein [Lachnospiraceae bacterium]|nr:HPr family phosphocarrier protein [Lachnospiraceae bacterium]